MDGKTYSFPYTPYDIQLRLMDAITEVLESGKIGLLESPTGTGKSLSLICASITWLNGHKQRSFHELSTQLSRLNDQIKAIDSESRVSSDWIALQTRKTSLSRERDNVVKMLHTFDAYNARNERLKGRKTAVVNRKQAFVTRKSEPKKLKTDMNSLESETLCGDADRDDDVVDYCSDDEVVAERDDGADTCVTPKIIYCSRTHSQLAQYVSEVKRTSFATSSDTPLRLVSLGSRNALCVNPSVAKLKSNNLINERCLELQSNGKHKCQMHKQALMSELRDDLLAEVHDIEEIVKSGTQSKACPYYSTRLSIPEAELIILPYNILLHSGTRNSYGIPLKGNIVIIDEAHNLLETINNIYSVDIMGSHIIDAHKQLTHYLQKYYSRLNPKNLMYIKQIIFILNKFVNHLKSNQNCGDKSVVFERLDFLLKLEIENLNLFKILEYCDKSQIARKLHGFYDKQKQFEVSSDLAKKDETITTGTNAFLAKLKNNSKSKRQNTKETNSTNANIIGPNINDDTEPEGSPLYVIKEFLSALVNPMASGRIITHNDKVSIRKSIIKYVLLNPGVHFKEIVNECRAVILAGGTMQPISQYLDHLFTPLGVKRERIQIFSCGHVIPQSNLMTIALGVGPNGSALNYTYQNRNNKTLIEETGRTVSNLCNIIPGGVVCFFSSYDYEELLYNHWNNCGILKSIETKGKRVFREPRKAGEVQTTLSDYSRCVGSNKKGALLLCVVGGKMSEGINFSDDLGRAVIVVGLPYANKNSLELQEKLKYLNSQKADSGKIYYENLCMKAVNQSIGRAIRHKNDYAVIVLLDNRYANSQNIRDGLPKWISVRFNCYHQFSQAFSSIRQFFIGFNK